jgi:hypothetical protein
VFQAIIFRGQSFHLGSELVAFFRHGGENISQAIGGGHAAGTIHVLTDNTTVAVSPAPGRLPARATRRRRPGSWAPEWGCSFQFVQLIAVTGQQLHHDLGH